jgi:hypothetical protein
LLIALGWLGKSLGEIDALIVEQRVVIGIVVCAATWRAREYRFASLSRLLEHESLVLAAMQHLEDLSPVPGDPITDAESPFAVVQHILSHVS